MRLFFAFLLFTGCYTPISFACEGKIGTAYEQCAPNFSLESTDKRIFTLEKHRGKIVIVNFWATWCEPCIEELPTLEALYQKKIPNLEFVSISIDNGEEDIKRFFEKNKKINVSFPILKDFDKKVANQWQTYKVPETYILDQEGKVLDKVIGIRDWTESITVHYLELLTKSTKR